MKSIIKNKKNSYFLIDASFQRITLSCLNTEKNRNYFDFKIGKYILIKELLFFKDK